MLLLRGAPPLSSSFLPFLLISSIIIPTFLPSSSVNGAAQFVFFGNQFGNGPTAAAGPSAAAVESSASSSFAVGRQGKALAGEFDADITNVIGDAPGGRDGLETIFFGQVTRSPLRPVEDIALASVTPQLPHFETTTEGVAIATAAGSATASPPPPPLSDDTIFFGQVTRAPRPVVPSDKTAAAVAAATDPQAATSSPPPRDVADTIFFGQVTRPPPPTSTFSKLLPLANLQSDVASTTTSSAVAAAAAAAAAEAAKSQPVDTGDTIFFGQVTRPPRPTTVPPPPASSIVSTTPAAAAAFPQQQVRSISGTPGGTSAAAAAKEAKHVWNGHTYYLSWRTGQNNFEWAAGVAFCNSLGMRLVSLDSPDKVAHFLELVAAERPLYFWAGGELLRAPAAEKNGGDDEFRLRWLSGSEEAVVERGAHPWSTAGKSGAPEPDGASPAERCLAVQNNLFRCVDTTFFLSFCACLPIANSIFVCFIKRTTSL
jgi:hypothetical protein